MARLDHLTEQEWDRRKQQAHIPDTNIFKALLGGAANVGKAIREFQPIHKAWKELPTKVGFDKYHTALDKLLAAFAKFLEIKEFTTPEAKAFQTYIKECQREIALTKQQIRDLYAKHKDCLEANSLALTLERLHAAGMDDVTVRDLLH